MAKKQKQTISKRILLTLVAAIIFVVGLFLYSSLDNGTKLPYSFRNINTNDPNKIYVITHPNSKYMVKDSVNKFEVWVGKTPVDLKNYRDKKVYLKGKFVKTPTAVVFDIGEIKLAE